MNRFKDRLPQDSRQEYSILMDEGKSVGRASLPAALNAADLAARSMATSVTMRRSSWLQAAEFPHLRVLRSFQSKQMPGSMALKTPGQH